MDKNEETEGQEDLKQELERNRLHIVEMLAPEGPLLDRLRSKGILSEEDNDLIKNKNLNKTRREQAGCFLDIICKKGLNGMLSFIEGLEYTNRELYKTITGKEPKQHHYQRFNRESDPQFLEYVNHLTTKFIVLTKQLHDVRDERESVSQERKILQDENKQLKKEKDDLKVRLVTCERIMKKNLRAHAELSKLQEEHIIIQKTLQEYMKENSDYQKKCHQLQLRKDKLEQANQQAQLDNDKLRDKLKDVRANFTREQNLSKQLCKQIAKVPSIEEYEMLMKEKNFLTREMRVLKTCSITLSDSKALTLDNDLKVRIETFEDQINQLQKECEQLATDLYETRKNLDELEREKDQYQNRQEKLMMEKTILEENCSVFKERRDALLKQLQQSKEERDDAIKERNKAHHEVEERTFDRDRLIYEKQELDDECLKYKQQVYILHGTIAQMKKKLERLTGDSPESSVDTSPAICPSNKKLEFMPLKKDNENKTDVQFNSFDDEDKLDIDDEPTRFRKRSYNLKYYEDGNQKSQHPDYLQSCSVEGFRTPCRAFRTSSISAQTNGSIKRSTDVEEMRTASELSFTWDNLALMDENPDLIRYLPIDGLDDESSSVADGSSINLRFEPKTLELSLTVTAASMIDIIGGNVTGIFAKTTIMEENLEEGDQLMSIKFTSDKEREVNFVECTLQFAKRALNEAVTTSSTNINIIVSKCHKAYENFKSWLQMGRTSGDQFYIRSRINMTAEESVHLNVFVGDILQIIDTLYDEQHWLAKKTISKQDSEEMMQGIIPNYEKAQEINSLMGQGQSGSALKRKPVIKTKTLITKPYLRDVYLKTVYNNSEKSANQPYITVNPSQCPLSRPVIIYGPEDIKKGVIDHLQNLETHPQFQIYLKSDIMHSNKLLAEELDMHLEKEDVLKEIFNISQQVKTIFSRTKFN